MQDKLFGTKRCGVYAGNGEGRDVCGVAVGRCGLGHDGMHG